MVIRTCQLKKINQREKKVSEQDITVMQYKRKKTFSQLVIGLAKIGK